MCVKSRSDCVVSIQLCNIHLQEISQERDYLKEKVSLLEEQVKVAAAASNSRLQEAKEKHAKLGRILKSVMELHNQMGDDLHS